MKTFLNFKKENTYIYSFSYIFLKEMEFRTLHIDKPGLRVLGIAESFNMEKSKKSILVGIVMRGDFIIDGVIISNCNIGGMDSTEKIIEMFKELNRDDINLIMLNGCIISWFNIIDLNKIYNDLKLPLICITYEESPGLEKYIIQYFPKDYKERIEVYKRNGERIEVLLKTGYKVFIRFFGISLKDSIKILNKFTLHGRIPEPLRVSKLFAKSLIQCSFFNSFISKSNENCNE
jgi:endonuclease V-like protein UPF0215 family